MKEIGKYRAVMVGPRLGEPVTTLVRFYQASDRLEVLRGIKDAQEKLVIRMTDRFGPWNIQDGKYNYRFIDMGTVQ